MKPIGFSENHVSLTFVDWRYMITGREIKADTKIDELHKQHQLKRMSHATRSEKKMT